MGISFFMRIIVTVCTLKTIGINLSCVHGRMSDMLKFAPF